MHEILMITFAGLITISCEKNMIYGFHASIAMLEGKY